VLPGGEPHTNGSLVHQRRQMSGPRRGGVEAGLLANSMSQDIRMLEAESALSAP
jgi:hypothetical protein